MRPHAAKLVTGSLQGVLRVHKPHGRGFRPEDCLLEAQLEAGILQIKAGRFAGCARQLGLKWRVRAASAPSRMHARMRPQPLARAAADRAHPNTPSASGGLCLAVLFPRKLAVLRFEAAGSSYLQV